MIKRNVLEGSKLKVIALVNLGVTDIMCEVKSGFKSTLSQLLSSIQSSPMKTYKQTNKRLRNKKVLLQQQKEPTTVVFNEIFLFPSQEGFFLESYGKEGGGGGRGEKNFFFLMTLM